MAELVVDCSSPRCRAGSSSTPLLSGRVDRLRFDRPESRIEDRERVAAGARLTVSNSRPSLAMDRDARLRDPAGLPCAWVTAGEVDGAKSRAVSQRKTPVKCDGHQVSRQVDHRDREARQALIAALEPPRGSGVGGRRRARPVGLRLGADSDPHRTRSRHLLLVRCDLAEIAY